ncbi:DUF6932 family protein [Adhaeribacter rhizoryzae]|uniref:Uncharacterized protein n=1 Tax=Adhaeribacter rhizoryzae TaxID=2607907 RepID=A0A5M6DMF2_9BACT|nr:hypothetical protein [Adhaeribacter rhizoryzae]KAA5548728.1 hypothetical protein F0145_04215 [Adhaeribacter rhizoryzae]
MLKFNSKGLLVPNSNIKSSLSEFRTEFVTNLPYEKRQFLYDKYIQYSDKLKACCNNIELLQWIDGSFTTKISSPGDIDLVTFIDHSTFESNQQALRDFKFPESIHQYGVDAYLVIVYPIDHKKYPLFIGDRLYWMDRFDKTRRNKAGNRLPKGFLEILY